MSPSARPEVPLNLIWYRSTGTVRRSQLTTAARQHAIHYRLKGGNAFRYPTRWLNFYVLPAYYMTPRLAHVTEFPESTSEEVHAKVGRQMGPKIPPNDQGPPAGGQPPLAVRLVNVDSPFWQSGTEIK